MPEFRPDGRVAVDELGSRGRSGRFMDYESFFANKVSALKDEGRYRVFADLERRVGAFPKARLHRNGIEREVTIWCSNDYLAMGHHPVVLEAMHGALDRSGAG